MGGLAVQRLHDAVRSVADWFMPPICAACHVPVDPARGDFLCRECRRDLDVIDEAPCVCRQQPNPPEALRAECTRCKRLGAAVSFASARSAFPYAGVAGHLIRNLKYRHREATGMLLARLIVGALGHEIDGLRRPGRLDALVPVPAPIGRRFRRGGRNHVEFFAEPLARLLDVAYRDDVLVRVRATPPQARKSSPAERIRNVAGAFGVDDPRVVVGWRVLLVDDVMTTGATAASAAGALRDAGAAEVHVVTIARAGVRN